MVRALGFIGFVAGLRYKALRLYGVFVGSYIVDIECRKGLGSGLQEVLVEGLKSVGVSLRLEDPGLRITWRSSGWILGL